MRESREVGNGEVKPAKPVKVGPGAIFLPAVKKAEPSLENPASLSNPVTHTVLARYQIEK